MVLPAMGAALRQPRHPIGRTALTLGLRVRELVFLHNFRFLVINSYQVRRRDADVASLGRVAADKVSLIHCADQA